MGIEIERKFLVTDNSWLTSDIKYVQIKQGYLKNSSESSVRIRVAGEKGFITVKGKIGSLLKNKNSTIMRLEFEYEIPVKDALEMLKLCENPLIEKVRYQVYFMDFEWCIDLFEGDNQGLVVAEIELESEEQKFETPHWAGEDVSDDPRYLNSNLITNPFKKWHVI
ncbi:MAG: CYTH domain-containing protein [Desulfamplus sp.]|nr:CYTH domain-containing protein [Desulfamplus sp.]